jgi:hypothetical protein
MRTLSLLLAMGIHVLHSSDILDDAQGLVGYTMLLLAYLGGEVLRQRLREGYSDWLNPVILASVLTFILSFGVSNVLFFLPDDTVEGLGLEPVATPWMNQLMLLVVIAAISMWSGYDSWLGRELGTSFRNNRLLQNWIISSTQVNRPVIYTCVAISLCARLVMVSLGVYGFSADYGQLIAVAAYTQYLSIGESLGLLALLGIAIQCFSSPRPNLFDRQLLIFVLSYEVLFGFLSGFKSQVCMPFIILGLVYYSQYRRFPRWMLPAVLVGIFAAYAVIEPFRFARYHEVSFDGTDLGNIAATMATAQTQGNDDEERPSTALSVLARLNLTYVASKGIEYAATTRLPEDSPNFLGDIFLSPVHALIPRILWEDKPVQNIGLWYSMEVIGYRLEDGILSSTAMGPVTYLNFAGGPIAVIIGFFTIGVFQRAFFDGLRPFSCGGLVVFLGLLRLLTVIDSAFNTIFTAIIRLLPLLLFAQYLLFYSPRPLLLHQRVMPRPCDPRFSR